MFMKLSLPSLNSHHVLSWLFSLVFGANIKQRRPPPSSPLPLPPLSPFCEQQQQQSSLCPPHEGFYWTIILIQLVVGESDSQMVKMMYFFNSSIQSSAAVMKTCSVMESRSPINQLKSKWKRTLRNAAWKRKKKKTAFLACLKTFDILLNRTN